MKNKQGGFTLVEIAIVLVIIGLLLGGVLKGQELINSAKVKNLANDFRSVPTFVFAYQDKFRAQPGDDNAANNHVGTVANPAVNGNASGRIDGDWNAPAANAAACGANNESCEFWAHVRLANLAAGTTVFGPDYIPRNADGGRIGVTGISPMGAAWPGNFFVCSTAIQGRFARQLDIMMDDGNTATGNVRVLCVNECASVAAAGAPANLTTANDANLYTVCSSN